MKKILLALAILTAFPALSQTAVTAPSAPTIPALATVSPNATAALLLVRLIVSLLIKVATIQMLI